MSSASQATIFMASCEGQEAFICSESAFGIFWGPGNFIFDNQTVLNFSDLR